MSVRKICLYFVFCIPMFISHRALGTGDKQNVPYRPDDIVSIMIRTDFYSYLRDEKPDARIQLLEDLAKGNPQNALSLSKHLENYYTVLRFKFSCLLEEDTITHDGQAQINNSFNYLDSQICLLSFPQKWASLSALLLIEARDSIAKSEETFLNSIKRPEMFMQLPEEQQQHILAFIEFTQQIKN